MKNKKNATSPQKERCHNWKAAWKWVKVLYLTNMLHIYALILLSSPQTHTFSPTLTPHIKTCQNDWRVDGCCHLITVQGLLIFVPVWSIFFILLCGLGTNLGVLTPFIIWQSSLSSLSFWFMSPPLFLPLLYCRCAATAVFWGRRLVNSFYPAITTCLLATGVARCSRTAVHMNPRSTRPHPHSQPNVGGKTKDLQIKTDSKKYEYMFCMEPECSIGCTDVLYIIHF